MFLKSWLLVINSRNSSPVKEHAAAQCPLLIPVMRRTNSVDTLKFVTLTLVLILPSPPGVYRFFPKTWEPPQRVTGRKLRTQGPTSARHYGTKFSRPVYMAHGICASCCLYFLVFQMFHSLQIYRPECLHAFLPCVLHYPPISFAFILPFQYKVTVSTDCKLSKSSYLAILWPSVLHCTLFVVTFSVYYFG